MSPDEEQRYIVIGDTVNLASRIKALGSRRAEFEFVDRGEVQIRGKVEPVRVWAVVAREP